MTNFSTINNLWPHFKDSLAIATDYCVDKSNLLLNNMKEECFHYSPAVTTDSFTQYVKNNPGRTLQALGSTGLGFYNSTPVALTECFFKRFWNGYCITSRINRNVQMIQKRQIVKQGKLSAQINRELFNIRLEIAAHTFFAAAGTADIMRRFTELNPRTEKAILTSNLLANALLAFTWFNRDVNRMVLRDVTKEKFDPHWENTKRRLLVTNYLAYTALFSLALAFGSEKWTRLQTATKIGAYGLTTSIFVASTPIIYAKIFEKIDEIKSVAKRFL